MNKRVPGLTVLVLAVVIAAILVELLVMTINS
jgi:hypothetical protein